MKQIGVIGIENQNIFVGENGILKVSINEEETPVEAIRRELDATKTEYLGNADNLDIFLASPIKTNGEWVSLTDRRLTSLQTKIIPHLKWTGLL